MKRILRSRKTIQKFQQGGYSYTVDDSRDDGYWADRYNRGNKTFYQTTDGDIRIVSDKRGNIYMEKDGKLIQTYEPDQFAVSQSLAGRRFDDEKQNFVEDRGYYDNYWKQEWNTLNHPKQKIVSSKDFYKKEGSKFQQGGMPQMDQQMPMGMQQMPQNAQQIPMQQEPEEAPQMPSAFLLDENNQPIDQYNNQLAVQFYNELASNIKKFLNNNMMRPKSKRVPEDSPFRIEPGTDNESLDSLTNALTNFMYESSSLVFDGKPIPLKDVRDKILNDLELDIFDIEGIDQIYGGLSGFEYLINNEFNPNLKFQIVPDRYKQGGPVHKKVLVPKNTQKYGTGYFADIAKSYK